VSRSSFNSMSWRSIPGEGSTRGASAAGVPGPRHAGGPEGQSEHLSRTARPTAPNGAGTRYASGPAGSLASCVATSAQKRSRFAHTGTVAGGGETLAGDEGTNGRSPRALGAEVWGGSGKGRRLVDQHEAERAFWTHATQRAAIPRIRSTRRGVSAQLSGAEFRSWRSVASHGGGGRAERSPGWRPWPSLPCWAGRAGLSWSSCACEHRPKDVSSSNSGSSRRHPPPGDPGSLGLVASVPESGWAKGPVPD